MNENSLFISSLSLLINKFPLSYIDCYSLIEDQTSSTQRLLAIMGLRFYII